MTATLTIAICTRDRPGPLHRCLQSIATGTRAPHAVVVSDDSDTAREVCAAFPGVTYIAGPRRGLCANRNFVLKFVATTHFALIDDDGYVSHDFVEKSLQLAEASPGTVFTGIVREAGTEIAPSNSFFLGHFGKLPNNAPLRNINLNCNLMPTSAIKYAVFDEFIRWGYEDTDFCAQLIAAGFEIKFTPLLKNHHEPPNGGSGPRRFQEVQNARIYTSIKRHLIWQKSYPKLAVYIIAASAHRAVYGLKKREWHYLAGTGADMIAAIRGAWRERIRVLDRSKSLSSNR